MEGNGYTYAVSMDLEKFFDIVNQSKLIEVLSRTIKDGRLISLIHKYLNAGSLEKGFFEKTEEGLAQGGSLSLLCGNVMLNELDKELERRAHRYVRYADDIVIMCKSRKSAERAMEHIIPFIEKKLFLRLNRAKTTVTHISKIKYLGYAFYRYKRKCKLRVHPKSIKRMNERISKIHETKSRNQQRKAKERTGAIRTWLDKLLFISRYEKVNVGNRPMAPEKNPNSILETMEESENQI